MKRYFLLLVIFLVLICGACNPNNTVSKIESGNPSQLSRMAWQKYLKVTEVAPDAALKTTVKHISNVSPEIAIAKMNQSLGAYNAQFKDKSGKEFVLATVYGIGETDVSEYDKTSDKPVALVTTTVVQGHLYYVGFLDYAKDTDSTTNRGAYEQTNGIIPAVAVVDGENAEIAGWIRTADDQGRPYQIKYHLTNQAVSFDSANIYRHLRDNGYSTAANCNIIDSPRLQFNEQWGPYFIATYNIKDAGCNNSAVGSMEHPLSLLVTDAQTGKVTPLALDDPLTAANERDPRIDTEFAWVDHIYSRRVMSMWVRAWGDNPANYGISSHLGELVLDHGILDELMGDDDTNVMYIGYMMSTHAEDSVAGVLVINSRDGTATFQRTTGVHAMATRSSAVKAIRAATTQQQFDVEGLDLHTIYGVHTWIGELTRPAENNRGERSGSFYEGTVLFLANHDHMPAHVVWAKSRHEAYLAFQKQLLVRASNRVGSNAMEIKEVTGRVKKVTVIAVEGNTEYIIWLEGDEGTFELPILYVGDPKSQEVMWTETGHSVTIKYGDVKNSKVHYVVELHNNDHDRPESHEK